MTIIEEIEGLAGEGCEHSAALLRTASEYPTDVAEILVYHRIHFHMAPGDALKSHRLLRSEFVDWNEVRISPIREIQEQVKLGTDSLELSVYIKDTLEFVHRDRQSLDLEFLVEQTLTEIRRYLRQLRGIDPATIELMLMRRREHPVLPLTPAMEKLLLDHGVVSEDDSRDRRQKDLFEQIGPESATVFHHLLLDHCRVGGAVRSSEHKSVRTILGRLLRSAGRGSKKKATRKGRSTSGAKGRTTKTRRKTAK